LSSQKEVANVTDNDSTGATPPEEEPNRERHQEPDTSQPAEDPGYLTETGEAVGEDGSVAPIIGGLPAVEGSAWDIGAPRDERGAGLAEEQGSPPGQASPEDTRSS
jgi:hypothetical protein